MLQQLTPRVYQLDFSQEQDRPVLGYIRGDRFSLMVDAGNSPEHVQAYLAALEESGFCQPDFVALTHSHWDHCFGLASLPMPSIACVQTITGNGFPPAVDTGRIGGKCAERHCPSAVCSADPAALSRSGEHSGGTAHYGFFREHDAGLGKLHL